MLGACNTQFLTSKSFKYYFAAQLTSMKKAEDKFVFNSMLQDIKELMWAAIVKECFLRNMRLDLILERICGI